MTKCSFCLPTKINDGPLLTSYSLPKLKDRLQYECPVLPIVSLGTPAEIIEDLGPMVLPPLYHEALNPELKSDLLDRIRQCFPYYDDSQQRQQLETDLVVIELPRREWPAPETNRIACFSVDTAVEEHGPHLPLATDTIQSYAVLDQLQKRYPELITAPPLEYGHLTWGLPFGMSIDITPGLLIQYVAGYADALMNWLHPTGLYVVDVHGSIVHRNAIEEGLRISSCEHYQFRWLHEPLIQFAGERGDQHAGGVETALIELISNNLVDREFFPDKTGDLVRGQMQLDDALELSADLSLFVKRVEDSFANKTPFNGIVGDIGNYEFVDAREMLQRMWNVASGDVDALMAAME
ncbi:MAG: creatininase family protein [Planctomycetota bacterium]|nr:creatininase family protein [Planctomycetota bacterium]